MQELTNKRTALETDISLLKYRYPFSNIRLLPLSCLTTLIILLQHLLQVRSLVEYFPCKLRVGNDSPVAIVLQGTGTDIQPLAHLLACEEKFTAKSSLCVCTTSTIRLPTPLNAEMTSCISSVSMFKSLAVSIISVCF